MPTLPPGTPNYVNLTYTPTWLFTPNTSAANNVRLQNFGQNIVYVGQADVTVNTGLPLLPGSKPVELTNVTTVAVRDLHVLRGVAAGDRRDRDHRSNDEHHVQLHGPVCEPPRGDAVHDREHRQHLQPGSAERGCIREHHGAVHVAGDGV